LIWHFSFAQQYTNITTKDGLPSDHVYRITQDNDGFIWFITDKGMVKYNGSKLKTFTTKEGLPTNDIWDIRITPDNKIWYFSKSAKLGYIKTDSVYTFESNLKNEILYPIIINQNAEKIFFSSHSKIYNLKNKKWHGLNKMNKHAYYESISHPKLKGIINNPNIDSLFLVDSEHKIFKSLKKPRALASSYHRGQINDSMFCWINSTNYTILSLKNYKLQTNYYNSENSDFKTSLVRFNSANNTIQFSGKNFVGILDKNYTLKNIVHIPKELKSHFSFIDKNENLWIATFSNGVYFIPKVKRNASYFLDGEKIGKLQFVNKKLIANVYDKGFYIYKKKYFKPFLKEKDFIFNACYIDSLQTEYYLTNKRIVAIQDKNKIPLSFKRSNFINEITRDLVYLNGFLYGNNSGFINKINPLNFKVTKTYHQNGIRDITIYKNQLLIATSNGIKKLENDSLINIITNDVLNKPILSIREIDKNNLLVCTDGFGAYITDLQHTKQLEKSDFLSVQNTFIKKNEIWLATSKGLWFYLKENKTYRLKRKYTQKDGLNTNLINDVVIINDTIITSSNNGICSIPIKQKNTNFLLDLYFEKTTYNHKKIKEREISYSKNNSLNFTISSINFDEFDKLNYAYKLMPIQKKWENTNSRNIVFNNLKPNKYNLIIKKNGIKKTYSFAILPLWHQTIFAKTILTILILALITGIVLLLRKRELIKKIKKINEQRKIAEFELHALRSQMNPHFVFNSLNAIQYYITKNDIDLSEKYLVKFSRLIRMFFDFSRKKEIKLQEEINLLKGYLEIEKMRFGKNFNFDFYIDGSLDLNNTSIPTMLLQPIVENAVNHGLFHKEGKGIIEIFFTFINNKSFEVNIIDDGIGLKKSKEIQQKSLKNNTHSNKTNSTMVLNDRIALLNQSKQWHVSYKLTENKGTSVQLIFTKNE